MNGGRMNAVLGYTALTMETAILNTDGKWTISIRRVMTPFQILGPYNGKTMPIKALGD
ncbi:MAG: hypothetical protein ACD_37C00225G0002 [uncultured bacterium]|nr:MAG: hypothetical protein ACD_37C00225G0002 [uncultured bacterium]